MHKMKSIINSIPNEVIEFVRLMVIYSVILFTITIVSIWLRFPEWIDIIVNISLLILIIASKDLKKHLTTKVHKYYKQDKNGSAKL